MPRNREDDAAFLYDMLVYARKVVQIVRDKTFEQYQQDEVMRWAVERGIEIIGEAARPITQEFQDAHAEIPWILIIRQRHVLAHDYGEIADDKIWRVATIHLPELIEKLRPLVPPPPPISEQN